MPIASRNYDGRSKPEFLHAGRLSSPPSKKSAKTLNKRWVPPATLQVVREVRSSTVDVSNFTNGPDVNDQIDVIT